MKLPQWLRRQSAKTLPEDYRGSGGWEALSTWAPMFGRLPWTEAAHLWGTYSMAVAEAAYSVHPVVRACCDKIGSTAAEPRIEIGMDVNGKWQAVKSHPILDLLDSPHPEVSRDSLIKYQAMRRALTGAGYLWKQRNRGRGPGSPIAALLPIPSSWAYPVRPDARTAAARRFWAGYRLVGQEGVWPAEDFAVCRQLDPATTAGFVGCLEAAWRAFRLDQEREDYQMETLVNLKVPGVAVTTERMPTLKEREDINAIWAEKFGKGRRGDLAFFSGNGKVEIINPLQDTDWPGLTNLTETRLCAAFGVPPIIIHLRSGLERSTYSNSEQANKWFYQGTMAPMWESLADDLTLGLLRAEGEERLRIRFIYEELPAFQEDINTKAQRVIAAYTAGLISARTARAELGYDPDEEAAQIEDETPEAPPQPPPGDQAEGGEAGERPEAGREIA